MAAAARHRLVKWRDMWPYVTFSLFIIFYVHAQTEQSRAEQSRERSRVSVVGDFNQARTALALARTCQRQTDTEKLCALPPHQVEYD